MNLSLSVLIESAKAGKLISFPTDTVPALATIPVQAELIYAAKQRSFDKPLILMAAKAEDLWDYVQGSQREYQTWQKIVNQYWPGALTLVLPASDKIPTVMNPLEPTTIGIRVPNHPVAQIILAQTGPMATTSANLSGQPALETKAAIEAQFPEVLTLESTEYQGLGIPSTVAKWTGKNWQILRQGSIKLDNYEF
ncbi:L-threonylcarbamoyladenylate synthase [Dolichospermum sp. LEGE 00240]|jgi:L-threonylcarbamoyladenylate synthase|uniref:L-threonylcarbamoyladenylate synthase n=1 Tax=Aphanizomenonaceae TaxID=1892259 RepID=UPI00187EB324|nr:MULTISPECIES: L-threonylcarbamoyladenylate synthase [Aphanizomenonaceae]MDM3846254.1 L-threonylcarbamoyladenylate synthase [Aphanizomenon gracile PMC638.10]MDM3851027.1 L-threonylcarbamoyladenylate synthase [Aphanizomenon gracile PMC627.10]MDM3855816.1 L-threonylcarbamoyladenylate synthase [Aphanizomenon gracile PMC649.10]MDM3860744.1 L-threonylcarbamoyladenylate synthase [Aphanizomenon gracile PMC644.10]MBE9248268.1 L-threonylcarbamoyladenylate synthase [Dolichospermum sp. LEGE 00240]